MCPHNTSLCFMVSRLTWTPVQHTYGLLMDAYASINDLTGCQRVLESMASDSVVPNAVIWKRVS